MDPHGTIFGAMCVFLLPHLYFYAQHLEEQNINAITIIEREIHQRSIYDTSNYL